MNGRCQGVLTISSGPSMPSARRLCSRPARSFGKAACQNADTSDLSLAVDFACMQTATLVETCMSPVCLVMPFSFRTSHSKDQQGHAE